MSKRLSDLAIGEESEGFYRECANARFMRFERKLTFNYDVYHICRVDSNGFWYIAHKEENSENGCGYHYKDNKLGSGSDAEAKAMKKKEELLKNGYTFVGYYLRDISGSAMRVENWNSKAPIEIFDGVRSIVFTGLLKNLSYREDRELNWNKLSDRINNEVFSLMLSNHQDYFYNSFLRKYHGWRILDSEKKKYQDMLDNPKIIEEDWKYKSHIRDITSKQSSMALDWLVDNGYLSYRKQNTIGHIGKIPFNGWYNMYKVTDKGWSVAHLYLK